MVTHSIKAAERGSRVIYLADGIVKSEIDLSSTPAKDRHAQLKDFLNKMGW